LFGILLAGSPVWACDRRAVGNGRLAGHDPFILMGSIGGARMRGRPVFDTLEGAGAVQSP
jgi:hypothetical protein